jgi:hypothetical protein
MFLTFALGSLAFMMLPETATSELFESFIDVGVLRSGIPPSLLWLAVGCWLAAMTLVEIFYIGGSFGLYLNCRTHLEGWDVELTFRRLGKRLAAAAAALALLLCPVAFGAVKRANNSADATAEKSAAHEKISTVLSHPDFEIHKTKIRMPKDFKEDAPAADFSGIFNAIGYVIFWAVVAFAVWKLIEFIIKYRHTLKLRAGTKAAIQPVAKSVMGLDVTPESLPEDVVRAAREKWEEGDFHGALSLLYRGSLSWLLVHAALPVRDSDTEGDCLRHTQKLTDAAPRGYFEKLTVQWIAAAYGSRAPANEIMRALFNEWPFGPGEKPA